MKPVMAVMIALMVLGCSAANMVVEPDTEFQFKVATGVNPDGAGRPSPVVVRYYELSSRSQFDNSYFDPLFDAPETALGPDLLVREELELQPGTELEITRRLNPNARFVGLVAAYRDIEVARWRVVIEVDPTGYDERVIHVEPLALYVLPD